MYDILTLKAPKDVHLISDLPNTITTYYFGSIKNSGYADSKSNHHDPG